MVEASQETGEVAAIWPAVGELIDSASIEGVLAHKLGPLAAVHRRADGDQVPEEFAVEERAASFATLSATALLRRIRELGDGPIVLLKGPEVAALYPPNGRRFGDIDVLTPAAAPLDRCLREHGFVEVDRAFDHTEHHHLEPLRWPVVPLCVEVHASPHWPRGLGPPTVAEIVDAAVPSVTGVEGVSAPCKLHHALLLAAHAWAHKPLQRIRDLLDVAVFAADESPADLERLATAWGIRRIWQTTQRAIDALFYRGARPAPLKVWARHLPAVRERTVFESHLQAVLSPFWARPPGPALMESLAATRTDLFPAPGETWSAKRRRIQRAIRDAGVAHTRRSE
jgi:putative nucleotidyltransferase-like protein